ADVVAARRSAAGGIEDLLDQTSHRDVVALGAALRSVDKRLRIQMLPGEGVAGVEGELTQEGALCASVALPKRMNRVDLGVVVGDQLGEPLARQLAQMPLVGELAQHVGRVALDALWEREHAAWLGERNASQLAGPRVDVLEDEAVELPQVPEVVGAL